MAHIHVQIHNSIWSYGSSMFIHYLVDKLKYRGVTKQTKWSIFLVHLNDYEYNNLNCQSHVNMKRTSIAGEKSDNGYKMLSCSKHAI